MSMSRRALIASVASCSIVPSAAFARIAREITWDDLIPPNIPYAEIVGEGFIDAFNDIWRPKYDENATKLNEALNGAYIKMPGYIIPIDLTSEGVTSFLLVPYVGACIHTPPPPANQLVFVNTAKPWPSDDLWDPVLSADKMEPYIW